MKLFKEYFPDFIFVNNKLKKEEIQNVIESNPLCEKFLKLFKKKVKQYQDPNQEGVYFQ